MTKTSSSKKVTLTHPVTGSQKQIDSTIYEPVKSAILESLKGHKGKTFTDLTDDVIKIIRKKNKDLKGNIPWYTISVRLDLETRGIVETYVEKGVKLNRIRKK